MKKSLKYRCIKIIPILYNMFSQYSEKVKFRRYIGISNIGIVSSIDLLRASQINQICKITAHMYKRIMNHIIQYVFSYSEKVNLSVYRIPKLYIGISV